MEESQENEGRNLGWPSMIKRMSQASPEAAGFSQDLFSRRLIEGKDQFLMLKWREKGHVILIIDNNDGQRGT